MKYCKYCGKPIEENAEICPFCNGLVSAQNNSTALSTKTGKNKSSSVSTGLIILSVLVPIVGLVLGFMKLGKDNEAARNYLIVSIVSLSVSFLFSVL